MTVSATRPVITLAYTGPGDYDFPFKVYDVLDLIVRHISTAGVVSDLDTGDYSAVTLAPDAGGTVTVSSIDFGTTGNLMIEREMVLEQQSDYVNNDAMDMEILERSLDEAVMMIQQVKLAVDGGLATLTWRGTWYTGVEYLERHIVVASTSDWYVCIVPHTSGVFDTDRANGYWVLAADISTVRDMMDAAIAAALSASQFANNSSASADESAASALEAEGFAEDASYSEINASVSAHNASNSAKYAYDNAVAAATAAQSVDSEHIVFKSGSTGAANFPAGTTAERPSTPEAGMTRFNTDSGFNEVYNGTAWVNMETGGDLQSHVEAEGTLVHGLGTAATRDWNFFALAAQGANADAHAAATGTAVHDLGTAALYPATDFASSAQGAAVDAHIVKVGTAAHGLGTASTRAYTAFATALQGTNADAHAAKVGTAAHGLGQASLAAITNLLLKDWTLIYTNSVLGKGWFRRLADGSMECRHRMTSSVSGDVTWTFPGPFTTPPEVSLTPIVGGASGAYIIRVNAISTTSVIFSVVGIDGSRLMYSVSLIATGNWA